MFNTNIFDVNKDLIEIEKVIDEKQGLTKKILFEKYIAMYNVTKEYIQEKNLILYGGLALNMILPKSKRFYDEYELPDYDFFSFDSKTHAKELADKYHKLGYNYIEVKPGIHYETYKVYVDFQPVADITDIPIKLFNHLLEISLEERSTLLKNNSNIDINIAPLSFLRLAFHVELSRPDGYIERWPKIYKRMALFYNTYPLYYKQCENIFVKEPNERVQDLTKVVLNYSKIHGFPVFGLEAIKIYLNQSKIKGITENDIFDESMPRIELISTDYKQTSTNIKMLLESMINNDEKVVLKFHSALNKSELIPKHFIISLISSDNVSRPVCIIYNSQACYSYKIIEGVNILTIDAMLSMMYASIFTARTYYNIDKIKCAINLLLNVQYKNLKSKSYIWKRFDLLCYGVQPQIEDVKRKRWNSKKTFRIYRP
jgi:hypothetical protein